MIEINAGIYQYQLQQNDLATHGQPLALLILKRRTEHEFQLRMMKMY